jgi:hypothetical protein
VELKGSHAKIVRLNLRPAMRLAKPALVTVFLSATVNAKVRMMGVRARVPKINVLVVVTGQCANLVQQSTPVGSHPLIMALAPNVIVPNKFVKIINV